MSRKATLCALVPLALALGAAPAGAQVFWSNWSDPNTGRRYSDFTVRDPWTGAATGRREVFDPYAGRAISFPTRYDPWLAPPPYYVNWAYRGPWVGRPRWRWRWR